MVAMKVSRASYSVVALMILINCQAGTSSDVVTAEGQNATLLCAFDEPGSDCVWKKDECCRLEFSGRFKVIGDYYQGDCSLAISPVQVSDNGQWECSSLSLNGTRMYRKVLLNVRSTDTLKGPLQFVESPSNIGAFLHDSAVFKCVFDGPASLCFWMKDGDTISIDGKYQYIGDPHSGDCSINITNVEIDDDGSWQCGYPRTTRMMSSLKSPTVNLSIGIPPEDPVLVYNGVSLNNGDTVYVDAPNDKLNIWCYSENGKPASTLSWTLGNSSKLLQMVTSETNQVFKSDEHSTLFITRSKFLQKMSPSWNQEYLTCEVDHPLYGKNIKRIQIRLVIPNYQLPTSQTCHE